MQIKKPKLSHVRWPKTYRAINSCYPPCDIWEDIIASADDWEMAFEIEAMSNDRVRNDLGDIHLIPKERMVIGTNSWWVVSAFTKINPLGSRFCDGSFGAYYAADRFLTALKEKAFGTMQQFMLDTAEPILGDLTVRMLVGSVDAQFHDIRDQAVWRACYHDQDYSKSQALGVALRTDDSDGVVYQSVRDPQGECFAAFWPDVVGIPTQERHVTLHWDGEQFDAYCIVGEEGWVRFR